MKRYKGLLLICLASVCMLTSCMKQYKQIKLDDFKVVSVTPDGARAADVIASVSVDNPAKDFVVESLNGTVKICGEVFGCLTAEGIKVGGKSKQVYSVPVRAELDPQISLFRLMGLRHDNLALNTTVDITAKIKFHGGFGKTIEYKDVPLDTLQKLL